VSSFRAAAKLRCVSFSGIVVRSLTAQGSNRMYTPLKFLSYVVLLLMVIAAAYSFGISIVHWSGAERDQFGAGKGDGTPA
jgi:hypothetical protein